MIEYVRVTWLKPDKWSDLTKWSLIEGIEINGYYTPAFFITDGGSIPFPVRGTFNPTGKGFLAFIAHDHKCKRTDYSRKQADKELYIDLQDCGVNKRRAWLMYAAVRAYAITMRIK